jgi:hypothetical protein
MPTAFYALATKQPPPPGQILVHNRVRSTPTRQGGRGFRAFWTAPGKEFALCDCGWLPDLGVHYVVAAIPE